MKEATGELSVTVITVVAIAAVATLFYTLVWPAIQRSIVNNTCSTLGTGWKAVSTGDTTLSAATASNVKWVCCSETEGKCTDPDSGEWGTYATGTEG